MRVLFLADAVFEDIPGGSRLAARELAHGLANRGHEVTFLVARQAPDSPDEDVTGSVRIVRYAGAGRPFAYIHNGKTSCAELCKTTSFDIVHTHFAYASIGALQAVPKSIPRIRTFHGPWDEETWLEDKQRTGAFANLTSKLKRRLRHQIEVQSLQTSSKVLTLSKCFANIVQESYGIAPNKICTVPGGTDIERFCIAENKSEVRSQLGLPLNRPLILSIRRLTPRMGLHNLIKAMRSVIEHHPEALLLIGGQGPEQQNLEHLVDSLGLSSSVKLLGLISNVDLPTYYQSADLFVLPTIALEGFGLVTTEALACGVPVIGTPVGAIPEILTPLDRRFISSSTTPQSLADSICHYLAGARNTKLDPSTLRDYVVKHYTWDRHVIDTEELYAEALGT